MAVNIPNLNVNAIGDGLQDRKNYEAILDVLQRYRKELNFYLMNLDLDNMPVVAENIDWIHQDIDGVKITVGNNAGDIAALVVEAGQISAAVGNNAGDIAALVVEAGQISAAVGNNAGDIAALVVTATGIQSQVTDNKTSITTVTQTAAGIQTQVTNLKNDTESSITQLSDSISSKVSSTDYTGATLVSMIEQTAESIKLSASKIDLTGITTITNPNGSYTTMYGQGIHIVAKLGQSTWTYPISWDTFISFELGRGIGTVFPDVVTFDGAVGFHNNVYFSDATVHGLELRFA